MATSWRCLIGRWSWWRIMVVVVSATAPAVLSYPAAAQWFSARAQAGALLGYVQQVEQMPDQRIADMLEAAHAYNATLPNGPLRDPYAVDSAGGSVPVGLGKEAYENTLAVGPRGAIGRLMMPAIRVDLPIYHDTGAASLESGVGHLYGSGLPVGGLGVHSVLTAHSGMIGSTLFSTLHEVRLGDTFQIQVLNHVVTYRVRTISTVLPDQIDSLRQVPGEDLVTLVTCTPVGVNTHRLLVTGVRVPTASRGGAAGPVASPGVVGPGFPWWPFPVPAAALAAIVATGPRTRSGAAMMDGGTAPSSWIEVTRRRPGREEFTAWASRRARVIGAGTGAEARADGMSRFATARQAGAYLKRSAGSRYVYTWTLKQPDGRSVGISAFAFSSAEAARSDAAHYIEHAMNLRSEVTPTGRGRSAWRLIAPDGMPVLFEVSSLGASQDADGNVRAALDWLARAEQVETARHR